MMLMMFDRHAMHTLELTEPSSAESLPYILASPKAVPKAKTALEASKIALNTLASATCLVPHGDALSAAIKGVLTVIETVEVSGTPSYWSIYLDVPFRKSTRMRRLSKICKIV